MDARFICRAAVTVEKSFDQLNFFRAEPAAAQRKGRGIKAATSFFEYAVAVPAQGSAAIHVPEIGRRFRLKLIDWPSLESDTKRVPEGPEMTKALDASLLSRNLILRNWRPGDAYRPRGRRQKLKVTRLFLSQTNCRERAQRLAGSGERGKAGLGSRNASSGRICGRQRYKNDIADR